MSTLARRLIILALGLLAGICAWPVVELVLHFQDSFASYRLFLPGPGRRHRGRDGGLLRRRRGDHVPGEEPAPERDAPRRGGGPGGRSAGLPRRAGRPLADRQPLHQGLPGLPARRPAGVPRRRVGGPRHVRGRRGRRARTVREAHPRRGARRPGGRPPGRIRPGVLAPRPARHRVVAPDRADRPRARDRAVLRADRAGHVVRRAAGADRTAEGQGVPRQPGADAHRPVAPQRDRPRRLRGSRRRPGEDPGPPRGRGADATSSRACRCW